MQTRVVISGLDSKGKDRTIGTIRWNGSGFILEPPGSPELREIMRTPIVAPVKGRTQEVRAQASPEAFMAGLQYQYKSAYFRASKAIEYR